MNPPRWELGHIGWFQEFWCRRHRGDALRLQSTPSRLASADAWFDSSAIPHDDRWSLPLPDWDGIHEYLERTLGDTLRGLANGDKPLYFFELALYHEDMHAEALLMTLQSLALPAPNVAMRPAVEQGANGDITLRERSLRMGAKPGDAERRFVFDNENFAHDVDVESFAIDRQCVSTGAFAAFVDDDGYARIDHWSEAGRRWRAAAGRNAPAYWRRRADGWESRTFDRWHPLDPDAPMMHVNAYEAEAWCAWAQRRLPDESEWELAALALEDRFAIPGPVWQWTATAFTAYPGFTPGPYADYSQPWFGDHRVLRGGSWATQPRLVHARFRNFYRPERHDAFAGFRTCARRPLRCTAQK